MKINPIISGLCLFLIYWLGVYFGIATPKSIDTKFFVIPYVIFGVVCAIVFVIMANWFSSLYYKWRQAEKKRRLKKKRR